MRVSRKQLEIMARAITPEMYFCGLTKVVVLPYLSSEVRFFVDCPTPYQRLIYSQNGAFIDAIELSPETTNETR